MKRSFGKRFGGHPEPKIRFLLGALSLAFAAIFLRLFYLQILNYPTYRGLSENNSLRLIPQKAPRGLITDRRGEVLAKNVPTYSLFLVPADMKGYGKTLQNLSSILQEPLSSLEFLVEGRDRKRKFEPILLESHLSKELVAKIEENRVHLPGIHIQMVPERSYPQGEVASHVLGYIGEISEGELLRLRGTGYGSGDWVGKKGIERVYDRTLKGKNGGVQVEVDASGVQRRTLAYKKPVPGQTLVLTLDMKVQRLAEELLGEQPGAIVVGDPRNGEILAMVSKPNFDPNEFVGGISHKEWGKLMKDELKPLQNRCIRGQYPPGSGFKLATTLAALEEKVIDLDQDKAFLCRGIFWFKTWPYRCHQTAGHGWMNLERAVVQSCDIFFYQTGLELKVDKIYRAARRLGLGSKTRVDLDSELTGLVPNPRWKESTQHAPWFPGNTIQMSIGQGYLLSTPLQMLGMTAGVAMDGRIFTPHLLKKVMDQKTGRTLHEKGPTVLMEAGFEKRYMTFLRSAMEKVVGSGNGTGKRARIPGVRVAGKTGTSENPHGDNHAWFGAYAPAQDPAVAVIVLVENGGEGGIVAAPMAKRLLEQVLGQEVTPWRTPTPDPTPEDEGEPEAEEAGPEVIPTPGEL